MARFYFAPVQGHTDAAYRHFHAMVYGGDLTYFSPFIRWEKDGLRPKDSKDITSDLNKNTHLVPQIIFRDALELESLIKAIKEKGYREVDLNMGCPFPLQTGHGRGAATILNENLASEIVKVVNENPDIEFSIKLRLGLIEPTEWRSLMPYLNEMKLHHIALHPRVAKQQYSGELYLDQFKDFKGASKNQVVYNGEIKNPTEIQEILKLFPDVDIMVARGILGRPSLFNEFEGGKEWHSDKRLEKMMEFHNLLFDHYRSVLCGDTQILSKIKPFWEYAESEIGRKPWKSINKATNMAKYQSAVALINLG